jgi:glycosyltransferase involved in cell wall biosynthesis
LGISVVICTKNEEKNIGRCLKAVHDLADEIIIVDSKSTDQTAQICKSFSKVKFYESDWMGFSNTKNHANSLATQDYILSLDADEELTKAAQQEISKLKNHLKSVYTINRLTNYCGQWVKHSGWFPDRHIRLFPKAGSQWKGDIHETLQFDSSFQVQAIEGLVNHYTYYTIEEHWARINTYTTLSAQKYVKYSNTKLIVSMIFNSKMRFIRHYILKLGILDGFPGLVIAALSAAAVFLKYAKAYQIKNKAA